MTVLRAICGLIALGVVYTPTPAVAAVSGASAAPPAAPLASLLASLGLPAQPVGRSTGFARIKAGLGPPPANLAAAAPSSVSPSLATGPGPFYVDGISDQNLPYWDCVPDANGVCMAPWTWPTGYFEANLFGPLWVGSPPNHIVIARFVVPWDIVTHESPTDHQYYPFYLQFQNWWNDIRSIGLTPQISFTYTTACLNTAAACGLAAIPPSPAAYAADTSALLSQYPAPFVEPWNEPNASVGLSGDAHTAALLFNALWGYCRPSGIIRCFPIAGNLLDTQANLIPYLQTLKSVQVADPGFWGLHPYGAANNFDFGGFDGFVNNLPNPSADFLAITEVGALTCHDGKSYSMSNTDLAAFFIAYIMTQYSPFEINYYGFMDKGHRSEPACGPNQFNTHLYTAGPNGTDVPTGDGLPAYYTFTGSYP